MPKPRKSTNRPLPKYWRQVDNTYYYRVPAHLRDQVGGRAEISLGQTLSAAYAKFGELTGAFENVKTMCELFDRYEAEIVSKKAPATQRSNRISLARLRAAFGTNPVTGCRPKHIYQYQDAIAKKHSEKAYNLDHEVLSHAFTHAIKWGLIESHPMTNKKVVKFSIKGRDRYVENWELAAWRTVAGEFLNAFIDLKGVTGLRKGDLLSIKIADIGETELLVRQNKTGGALRFPLTPALVAAIDQAKALRPVLSPHLFCTRRGEPYIKPDGTTSGFDSIWQRRMKKALAETKLLEKFTEHDLRGKVGSDSDSDRAASELLGNSEAVAKKHYRRRGNVVTPAGGFKA